MKTKTLDNPKKLRNYWLCQWPLVTASFLVGILYNFGALATPYFNTVLINVIEEKRAFLSVVNIVLIYIAVIVSVELCRALKRYFVRIFANRTLFMMRKNLYNNLLHMDKKEIEQVNMGDLLSRNISDVNKTVEGMRKLTTEIYDTVLLFFFYVAYMMIFDPIATLYSLIPICFAIFLAFLLRKPSAELSTQSRKIFAKMTDQTYDNFHNAMLYRLYSREEDMDRHYNQTLSEYEKKNKRFLLLQDSITPLSKIISLFGLIPIVYFGTIHVLQQDSLLVSLPLIEDQVWNAGILSGYIMTFVLMATKASNTSRLFSSVEKGLASWKKIKPYIEKSSSYDVPVTVEGNTLQLEHFTLKTHDRILMNDVTSCFQTGQIIGITGEISSGKTAFGKVFIRELDYEGSLILFGKELRDYQTNEIKGTVSYMGHNPNLLTMTLKENITYGDEKDVIPYLQMVSFEEDLNSMPEKEKTIIGNEGVRLSGGQQQRIALARTLYHQHKLIILDDPFSSIDSKTETNILSAIQELKKDCIVLLISHRLKIFPELDKVMVLHTSGEVSVGKHDDLLCSDSDYRRLFDLQQKENKENESTI